MKKLICLLCVAVICMSLVGCTFDIQGKNNDEKLMSSSDEETEIKITHMNADWPYYHTVDSLVLASSNIFEGKITDVFFDVVDIKTGNTASKDTKASKMLYTIYEIEVNDMYKGISTSKIYIKVLGGRQGYKEADQRAKMKEFGIYSEKNGIMVLEGIRSLNVGESYLFLTAEQIGAYHSIVNGTQFVYDITDAEKTNTFGYNEIKAYFTNTAVASD